MGSAYSNIVQATVAGSASTILLSATPQSTTGGNNEPVSQNVLAWNAVDIYSYDIYRQINNGGYSLIGTVDGELGGTYTDSAFAEGFPRGQFDYYVEALGGAVVLGTSNVASVTWPQGDENPLELAIAKSTNGQGQSVNTLTWNDIDAATYSVFRANPSNLPVQIAQLASGVFTYVDTAATTFSGTYQYYVLAADYDNAPIAQSPTVFVTW